ncbi:MAG: DUF1571 domain-containing protein [Bacteroidetes bacterium]|nr:DUF1571 domain-containing protein [Bacteroidota bacterium]
MQVIKKIVSVLLFVFLYISVSFSQNAVDISNKMFENAKKINTVIFKIVSKERFGSDYKLIEAYFKKQSTPIRIYYKQLKPNYGAEVLINEKYSKKALVNPNSFPWINVVLDPMSKSLRDGQHHSIYDAGFDYFIKILSELFEKNKNDLQNLVNYKGEINYNNIQCYKIELNNPSFQIIKYKVQGNYTVNSLASKLNICDYHIIERNPAFKEYTDKITIGTILNIPSDYSKKLILVINKITYLPVYMEIYDDKGLFEQYQFSEVQINPVFSENDFSETNKEYGF